MRSAFGNAVYVDGDDAIGAPGELVEGQGIGGAAVDQDAAVDDHRPEQAGNGDRGGERRAQRSRRQRPSLAAVQIGRHDGERNGQRRKFRRALASGMNCVAEFLGVHLRGLAESRRTTDRRDCRRVPSLGGAASRRDRGRSAMTWWRMSLPRMPAA